MAGLDEKQLYDQLTDNLSKIKISFKDISKPDPTVEDEVTRIFMQARRHRSWLVLFYIIYTVLFTAFVITLIHWQARQRVIFQDSNFEIIPQWALNILVTGMFIQFVGLLKIVTERVWDYRHFFTYHMRTLSRTIEKAQSDEPEKSTR